MSDYLYKVITYMVDSSHYCNGKTINGFIVEYVGGCDDADS